MKDFTQIANFERDVPLAPLTTMKVGGPARYLAHIRKDLQIPVMVDWAMARALPILVLGDGSNVLVSDRGFPGLVLRMETKGIQLIESSSSVVVLRVAAGLCWDELVQHTVSNGWWGIENMSLIPGTVGACPVQNVGAYGQESCGVITCVEAYDMRYRQCVRLENQDCQFGFRRSIFNTTQSGRYIIVSVHFRLSKIPAPCLVRPAVAHRLRKGRRKHINQAEIRDAIISLRTNGSLLPKPETLGSAGTFFRAKLIAHSQMPRLALTTWKHLGWKTSTVFLGCVLKYGTRVGVKVPSRMLIEACGLNGLRIGSVELFAANPAVVATHKEPPPKAADILTMIQRVRQSVHAAAGVEVPVEPNLAGFSQEDLCRAFEIPGCN